MEQINLFVSEILPILQDSYAYSFSVLNLFLWSLLRKMLLEKMKLKARTFSFISRKCCIFFYLPYHPVIRAPCALSHDILRRP